jgi:hypothetical protein
VLSSFVNPHTLYYSELHTADFQGVLGIEKSWLCKTYGGWLETALELACCYHLNFRWDRTCSELYSHRQPSQFQMPSVSADFLGKSEFSMSAERENRLVNVAFDFWKEYSSLKDITSGYSWAYCFRKSYTFNCVQPMRLWRVPHRLASHIYNPGENALPKDPS